MHITFKICIDFLKEYMTKYRKKFCFQLRPENFTKSLGLDGFVLENRIYVFSFAAF